MYIIFFRGRNKPIIVEKFSNDNPLQLFYLITSECVKFTTRSQACAGTAFLKCVLVVYCIVASTISAPLDQKNPWTLTLGWRQSSKAPSSIKHQHRAGNDLVLYWSLGLLILFWSRIKHTRVKICGTWSGAIIHLVLASFSRICSFYEELEYLSEHECNDDTRKVIAAMNLKLV